MDKLIVFIVIGAVLGPYIATFGKAILMLLGIISLIILYQAYKGDDSPSGPDEHEDFWK